MFQCVTHIKYLFLIDSLANSFLNIKYKSQIYNFQCLRKKSSTLMNVIGNNSKVKHTNRRNNPVTFLD